MGLVDYSSSDSEAPTSPPAKKRKPSQPSPSTAPSHPHPQSQAQLSSTSTLPPLPPTFHDLYASTVRQSTTDDPTLHQGRRRQIPHVPGNWPSHIYLEWRPSSAQHVLLASFLARLQSALGDVELNGFLTSDLGAPLPLHVSLSRPFVLSTAEKDEFLDQVTERIRRTRIPPLTLGCEGGVEWHRTPESNRSFLVLRVRSRLVKKDDQQHLGGEGNEDVQRNYNPELTALLVRCNTTVAAHGQPQLYQWADDARIGDAFHVSIAWSFAEPDEELRNATAEVFADAEFGDAIRQLEFEVDGVKAKIGNVVNHIPLARESSKRSRGLFGI
ncbi:hypothetical protein CONLIGDRAFT_635841 [Coniochaeta ligniaria NRRL 30616]|uniref:U6 snRNA phosphodiesterase n=1 Tax=Coniochaeta ligniaria NRRL 30616 TaxID=1408157 RepID=A0A1J7IFN8_9PEZI|nr:hypothetical protein CONLIGDRAFT_635841 [Coniochaeta ligniaria NRRL 30616]